MPKKIETEADGVYFQRAQYFGARNTENSVLKGAGNHEKISLNAPFHGAGQKRPKPYLPEALTQKLPILHSQSHPIRYLVKY